MTYLLIGWIITIWTMTFPPGDDHILPPLRCQLTTTQQANADHYRVLGIPPILWDDMVENQGRTCYDWPASSTDIACDWPICEGTIVFDPNDPENGRDLCNLMMGRNGGTILFQPVTSSGSAVGEPVSIYKPYGVDTLFLEIGGCPTPWAGVGCYCGVWGCCPPWLDPSLPPITKYMQFTSGDGCYAGISKEKEDQTCPFSEMTFGPTVVDPFNIFDPNGVIIETCNDWPE